MPALMRQKGARRELVLSSPTHSVIVSAAWLNLVKAPLRGREVALSPRGTWRSRLSRAGKQTKERLRRRLALVCHREERSDLAFSELANSKKRDCRASLAMTRWVRLRRREFCQRPLAGSRGCSVIARNEAISPFRAGKQTKERLRRKKFCQRPLAGSRGCSVIARNEAISVVRGWRTEKREIAALRSQ